MSGHDLEPLTLRPVDATRLLGSGLYRDALAAGWLKPCARREGNHKDAVRFTVAAVRAIEHRVMAGEYPPARKQQRRARK